MSHQMPLLLLYTEEHRENAITLRLQRSYFKDPILYFLDAIVFPRLQGSAKIRSDLKITSDLKIRSDLKNKIAGASG